MVFARRFDHEVLARITTRRRPVPGYWIGDALPWSEPLSPLPPNGPTLNWPRAPQPRQRPSWGECMFAPHDIIQAFYGGSQALSDPRLGNGNELAWQGTSRGPKQLVGLDTPAKVVAYGGVITAAPNAFADCGDNRGSLFWGQFDETSPAAK